MPCVQRTADAYFQIRAAHKLIQDWAKLQMFLKGCGDRDADKRKASSSSWVRPVKDAALAIREVLELQIIGSDVGTYAASQQAFNDMVGIAFRHVPNIEEASQLHVSFYSILRLGHNKAEFDQNIDGDRGVFKYEMHLLQKSSLWNLYVAAASTYKHRGCSTSEMVSASGALLTDSPVGSAPLTSASFQSVECTAL